MKLLILISFENALIFAYSMLGVLSVIGYIPQVWTLLRSTGRSQGTPISTWGIWTLESCIACAYVTFIRQDYLATLVTGIDVVACFLILALIVYNRFYRFREITPKQPKPHPILA